MGVAVVVDAFGAFGGGSGGGAGSGVSPADETREDGEGVDSRTDGGGEGVADRDLATACLKNSSNSLFTVTTTFFGGGVVEFSLVDDSCRRGASATTDDNATMG